MASSDRVEVSNSVDRLEETLRRDPSSVGESRGESSRIIFSGSVAVSVQIDDAHRIVSVEDIWRIH